MENHGEFFILCKQHLNDLWIEALALLAWLLDIQDQINSLAMYFIIQDR